MSEPNIHVGILHAPELEITFNSPFILNSTKQIEPGTYSLKQTEAGILFEDNIYSILTFDPIDFDSASFDIADVIIGINFHWERNETQRFQGSLKVLKDAGKLVAINIIPVESYLISVISSEMSATASSELLKAHAVISRSWLMAQLQNMDQKADIQATTVTNDTDEIVRWYDREDHHLYHVCADDHCQRYQGITRASTSTVKEAVNLTRGQILTDNNLICDARFSKCCGGISEQFENCWENKHFTYLTPVYDKAKEDDKQHIPDLTIEKNANLFIRTAPEAFCNTHDKEILGQVLNNYDQETTDFYRWKVTYTQAEISLLIRERTGIDFGDIVDLIPLTRGESGRIIRLKIIGTKRTIIMGKELEIRKSLSRSHLYSSAFVVDKTDGDSGLPKSFVLIGAGWGHGVGLCQIGAAVMGANGYRYDHILSHYFKGAELTTMY